MLLRIRWLLLLALTGCMVNPATGRRGISLVGEGREIEMGREADGQVTAQMGLVEDAELQQYVSKLGLQLAAASERPDLPWSFKVVDDPTVNAFALPGGFIYVTRGILANFESEAELAGVLGHEVGHVTARHSVSQITRQQIQAGALGVGMIFSERVRSAGGLLSGLGQILNLSYSRGHETEADELGLRYLSRTGYDTEALVGVFQMLAAVSGSGDGRVPEWQLTHPYPENREANIRGLIDAAAGASGGRVARDEYLEHLNGLVYGTNPRDGLFLDTRFVHPDMAFDLTFPAGWTVVNQRTVVAAISPEKDAIVMLQLADGDDPRASLQAFLTQDGVTGANRRTDDSGEILRQRANFELSTDEGAMRGEVAFVKLGSQLYQVLGYAGRADWGKRSAAAGLTISSLGPLTDADLLAVQPQRLEIVTIREATSLRALNERSGGPIPAEELARLNRVTPDQVLAAGTRIKLVRGAVPGR